MVVNKKGQTFASSVSTDAATVDTSGKEISARLLRKFNIKRILCIKTPEDLENETKPQGPRIT